MIEAVKKRLEELMLRYPVLERERIHIIEAYTIMENCFCSHGKLLIAGNGGSAADAEHIAGELMKGFAKPRKVSRDFSRKLMAADPGMGTELAEKLQGALPAMALTNHAALSTAYANDVDPLFVFAQQVYGYGRKGDVFLGLSTSGSSRNIIYAAAVARAAGIKVIGLAGRDGGGLKAFADTLIIVPGCETFEIQELHLPVYHALCLMLEERFFGGQREKE